LACAAATFEPLLGVDAEVIITPPCIFCMEVASKIYGTVSE
jgi:hypothetical protein